MTSLTKFPSSIKVPFCIAIAAVALLSASIGARGAAQGQQSATKRVPPNGLVVTIREAKYFAAQDKPKLNAMVNVAFAEPLAGNNQGVGWKCDYAGCFHGSLLQLLRESVGKMCHFIIKERDKKLNVTDEWPTHFIDIEDVCSITDLATGEFQEYVEGKPIIQGA